MAVDLASHQTRKNHIIIDIKGKRRSLFASSNNYSKILLTFDQNVDISSHHPCRECKPVELLKQLLKRNNHESWESFLFIKLYQVMTTKRETF